MWCYLQMRHVLTALSLTALTSLMGAGIGVGSWIAMAHENDS